MSFILFSLLHTLSLLSRAISHRENKSLPAFDGAPTKKEGRRKTTLSYTQRFFYLGKEEEWIARLDRQQKFSPLVNGPSQDKVEGGGGEKVV